MTLGESSLSNSRVQGYALHANDADTLPSPLSGPDSLLSYVEPDDHEGEVIELRYRKETR